MQRIATADRATGATDEALIRRAATGDANAFDSLVSARIDRCYRVAWSILQNDADAADATQNGVVLAWRHLPKLREVAAFDGWLNQIVANAARQFRRQRVRLREVQPIHGGADGEDDVAWMTLGATSDRPMESDAVVDRDSMRRAFGRLRPPERTILVLRYVDGRPVEEIAHSLGIPSGTVKSRLHYARKALESAMEAEA